MYVCVVHLCNICLQHMLLMCFFLTGMFSICVWWYAVLCVYVMMSIFLFFDSVSQTQLKKKQEDLISTDWVCLY